MKTIPTQCQDLENKVEKPLKLLYQEPTLR